MASRGPTGKAGPGSTKSRTEVLAAITSQSPAGALEQHAGAAVFLPIAALPRSADCNAIFARPWNHLLGKPIGDRDRAASILLSEFSFGLGETGDFHFQTLVDAAIRVVLAPFFATSLVSEAVRCGILLAPLPAETIQALGERLASTPETMLTIDLRKQLIRLPGAETIAFETHPWLRSRLLCGMDDLDEQYLYRENARKFRSRDRKRRPWLYRKPGEPDPE